MLLEVSQRARLACSLHVDGPIAQSVEQLAFNQWVAGSSPARLKFPLEQATQEVSVRQEPIIPQPLGWGAA
jgi:hypothetical protein